MPSKRHVLPRRTSDTSLASLRSLSETHYPRLSFKGFLQAIHEGLARPSILSSPAEKYDDDEEHPLPVRLPGPSQAGGHPGLLHQTTTIHDGSAESHGAVQSRVVVDSDFTRFTGPQNGDKDVESVTEGSMVSNGRGRSGGTDTRSDPSHTTRIKSTHIPSGTLGSVWSWTRNVAWRSFWYYFNSSFPEKTKERAYMKEQYLAQRQLAIAGALFFLITWAAVIATTPTPFTKFDWYGYFGISGCFTVPLLPYVLFNIAYRHPWLYQVTLFLATWAFPDLGFIEMSTCGYFERNTQCEKRNFFIVAAAAIGNPTLAIFALGQDRFWATLGAIQAFGVMGGLTFNRPYTPVAYYRDAVFFFVYQVFLLVMGFLREASVRQFFEVREQLKLQSRATQRAQVMEKRASDLQKRFVSYIFHEVRVPLNTALLAVQNLEGEKVFQHVHADQLEMVEGLTGSLSMMEKVLNDVLSFNRMESGRFSQAKLPFDIHKSIHLTALSHSINAQAKGIDLLVDLDENIDQLPGLLMGDEMRLRQITSVSNLVSNAIKFTQEGSVRMVTRLLFPSSGSLGSTTSSRGPSRVSLERQSSIAVIASMSSMKPRKSYDNGGTVVSEKQHSASEKQHSLGTKAATSPAKDQHVLDPEKGNVTIEQKANHLQQKHRSMAIIRIEVHDTGAGLRQRDLEDDRLFSPYVQTEIGRRQGGKGTGLGLALVRQIVQLSNGRLGVDSEHGKGSVFWLEMPYPLCVGEAGAVLFDTPGAVVEEPTSYQYGTPQPDKGRQSSQMVKNGTLMVNDPNQMAGQMVEGDTKATPTSSGSTDATKAARPGSSSSAQLASPTNARPELVGDAATLVPHRMSDNAVADDRLGGPSMADVFHENPSEAKVNCLVVDDDRLTRSLMSRMLKRLGHAVSQAENGQEALERIQASQTGDPSHLPPFDIVFLDNQMPLMTGVEVAQHVRTTSWPLFIVGCTGNALKQDQDEYLSAGADRILTKPIKQAAVEDAVMEAARKKLERLDNERNTRQTLDTGG